MKTETEERIEEGIRWLIGGAVCAIVIGFAWGGGVASTSEKMSGEAVLPALALPGLRT